ncbi:MAG: hypothetical protein IKF68_00415 [Erysipelotrichaceae bacterium]|nr:hypothetical protein [Erysipelotrichaceae bacterium]
MKENREKKLLIVSVAALLCIIAAVYFLLPRISFDDEKRVVEKGDAVTAEETVTASCGEVKAEKEFLDTDTTGTHELHYRVKRWIFERDIVFTYEVVDTVAPVITLKENRIIIDVGEALEDEEIKGNIETDEGDFTYTTDYNSEEPGTYPVDITATDDSGNVSTASFDIIVRDDNPPIVFRSGNGAKILKDSDFNINGIISYGDDCDPTPLLEIEGKVNTARTGTYHLRLTVTDASGNKTGWDARVEVVDKLPEDEEEEEERYLFEDFIEEYGGEGRMLGIDVSEWQRDIDFKAVRDAACEFVMMRIGFSHQGVLKADKKFHQNLEGFKEAGIPVGIYLFCYDNSEEYLLSSLDQLFEELGDTELELPIAFDWENFGNYQEYEISFRQLDHLYEVFAEEVEKRGYEPILYGSAYYLNRVWSKNEDRPLWMAQYAAEPTFPRPYTIWQMSEDGELEGIEGPVDLDILYTGSDIYKEQ